MYRSYYDGKLPFWSRLKNRLKSHQPLVFHFFHQSGRPAGRGHSKINNIEKPSVALSVSLSVSLADPQSAKKRIWSWWNEEIDGQMQYLKEKSWAYHVLTQSNEGLGIIFTFALDLISECAIERRICVWPNAFHRCWCFVHTEGLRFLTTWAQGGFFGAFPRHYLWQIDFEVCRKKTSILLQSRLRRAL